MTDLPDSLPPVNGPESLSHPAQAIDAETGEAPAPKADLNDSVPEAASVDTARSGPSMDARNGIEVSQENGGKDRSDRDEDLLQGDRELVTKAEETRKLLEQGVDEAGEQVDRKEAKQEKERKKEFERRRISLSKVEPSELQRVRRLFVEPKTYAEDAEQVFTHGQDRKRLKSLDTRSWLVAGAPRSGRMMMALRLALELMDLEVNHAESVWIYTDSQQSLLEVAAERNLPANSVVIFEDVFSRGRMSSDALFLRWFKVDVDLKRRKVWFIFTVPEHSDEFPLEELVDRYPIFRTEQPDLGQVFQRLVNDYFPSEAYPDENARLNKWVTNNNAASAFQPPRRAADLDYWFRRYGTNAARLEEWIKEGSYEQTTAAQDWFENLENLNYKLYALLVVLFDGLDVIWLDQIYEAAVAKMRELGMDGDKQFIDPRRIGTQALDNYLRLLRRGNQVDFSDEGYRAEAKRQIKNYQRMLWTLVDDFIGVVKAMNGSYLATRRRQTKLERRVEHDHENLRLIRRLDSTTQAMDDMRRLREVIAVALASIGIYHRERLFAILDDLAHNNETFVVLTASVMLAQIARQDDHHDLVIDVLSDWARSGDFDLMWACAVSISRVYEWVAHQYPLEDVEKHDTQAPDFERERHRTAARTLLDQLGELLAELATNYDAYDSEYVEQQQQYIHNTILTQLKVTEDFTDQILAAVKNGALSAEIWTIYQAAKPEDRVLIALQQLPEERARVDRVVNELNQKMHESWWDQIRLSVVNAVAYIASSQPEEMVVLVESWMQRDNSEDRVWQVGRMALNRLFRQTDHLDAMLLEKRAFPLLVLFKTILRVNRPSLIGLLEILKGWGYDATVAIEQQEKHNELVELLNDEPLNTALQSALNWYHTFVARTEEDNEIASTGEQDSADPEPLQLDNTVSEATKERAAHWEDQVYPELLKAINHATHEQRSLFRRGLVDIWLMQEREKVGCVRRVAHALIARSHVMDGKVLDLPQSKRVGLLIVDGAADDAQQYRMFGLAQQLAALAPLQIMRLGDARQKFIEGDSNPVVEEDTAKYYFTIDDFLQHGQRRPSLIMPLLQPRNNANGAAFEADKTYFVIVHSISPITDLPDFFDTLPNAASTPVATGNIFSRAKPEQIMQASASTWAWDGKLLIVSSQPQTLPAAMDSRALFLSEEKIDYAYSLLQRQIAKMLHRITPDEMWADLQTYIKFPLPRSAELLKPAIEEWLPLLGSIQHTHPRDDASLTIAWAVLALSRENGHEAVSIIESMLEGDPADETVFMRHQMGMACARMLFNFYNADPSRLSVETHGPLLRLLPAFNHAARDYSDLIPIWMVLLNWAQSSDWLTTLLATSESDVDSAEGSKLFESIDGLQERDARMARNWLERFERLSDFLTLFIDVGKSVDEFKALVREAYTYRQELNDRAQNKAKRGRRLASLVPPLAEPQLGSLLSFIPESMNSDNPEVEVLVWRIEQLIPRYREMVFTNRKDLHIQQVRNMETLAERMRDRLNHRLAGSPPEFKGIEKYYGLIIVQGDHKKLTTKAAELAYTFAMMRREEGEFKNVVLTVHRQGSQELVRYIRTKAKRKDPELFDTRRRLPLIGPALDRYTNAQLGFVIVLSDRPVLDYDDWGETDGWAERLWTIKPVTSKWQPSRGEHLDIDEEPEPVLQQIANRIAQRNNNHGKH